MHVHGVIKQTFSCGVFTSIINTGAELMKLLMQNVVFRFLFFIIRAIRLKITGFFLIMSMSVKSFRVIYTYNWP